MQFGIVLFYLIVMVLIGLYFARQRVKDSDDFMVAGRSLSQWILAGTLLATFVGSGTIVGGASFIYQYGPFAAIFFFAGTPIGIIILYFFLADKIRGLARYTVPEILEIRYGAFARAFGGITILLAYVGIASYQFTGAGYVLNITTGIPVWLGTVWRPSRPTAALHGRKRYSTSLIVDRWSRLRVPSDTLNGFASFAGETQ